MPKKFATSNNELPAVAFRYTNNSSGGSEIEAKESDLVPGCFVAERYSPALINAAEKGEIYLQDEGSQMIGGSIELSESDRFLDVSAAPGSKATQIAAKAFATKAVIVAGELHSHRRRFLLENCRKQGLDGVAVVQYDAESPLPFEDRSFDAVLVDAPCSGTGTLRHNPEIRYFLSPADIDELSAKQRRILLNASKMVKDGGSLIYSTCSVESEENESVAEVLDADASLTRVRPPITERFLGADGFGRTYPKRGRMDGFFIAKYEKMGGK